MWQLLSQNVNSNTKTRSDIMNFKYETERLILKILTTDYAALVLNFLYTNRDNFSPYEAAKTGNFYTVSFHMMEI